MIREIVRKELLEIFREGRFRVALFTLAILVVTAIGVGRQYYLQVNEQHEAARRNARNEWVGQGSKNPHSAAHYGTYAFKPKYPMSLLDNGVDKYSGVSIYLEAHKRNDAQYMAAQDQTALSRFGDLSPDFILMFMVPLFIILIAFNSVSRERESGTLRVMMSQGISPWKLALGKWLAVFTPVAVLTGLVFLAGGLLLANLEDFGLFSWWPLILLALVYLLYYGVFINVSILVSASVRKSSLAFVLLLGIWILSCLGMPKATSVVADALYPYPTQLEFEERIAEDKTKGLNGHDPWNAESKKLEAETLKKYGVDSVEKLPFNWDGYLMQKGEEHEAEIYFKHYQVLKEIYQKQSKVYRTSAALSPFLPARFLSMALCRTDYHAHWHFADEAEKYRLMLVGRLNGDMVDNSRTGQWDYRADEKLWRAVPDFAYEPVSYQSIVNANAGHFLILLAWWVLSGVGMLVAVRQMKVF